MSDILFIDFVIAWKF